MDAAQTLIAAIGIVVSFVTFCVMRFPHMRREQFSGFGAFSIGASLAGALAVLLFVMLLVLAQGAWRRASGPAGERRETTGHRLAMMRAPRPARGRDATTAVDAGRRSHGPRPDAIHEAG